MELHVQEMPVIPGNRVADTKRMIGKNGEERHKGSLTLTMEKSS
jgi:hypothetical protein